MALTADQITAKNFKKFYQALEPYLSGGVHGGFTPVGSIIAVMGNNAPTNYLKCDGAIYNIEDYPELANYFEEQFDNANFFGGDGATTFAVPDLRGEFLRGTGTNSHNNQGNGGDVGEHQDGTEFPNISVSSNKNLGFAGPNNGFIHTDSTTTSGNTNLQWNPNGGGSGTTPNSHYTSRPTNTSVLYCIAVKNIFLDVADFGEEVDENDIKEIIGSNMPSARQNFIEYSTDEQVVGKWIDGKPVYQKTFHIENVGNNVWAYGDLSDIPIDNVLLMSGFAKGSNGTYRQLSWYNNSTDWGISTVDYDATNKRACVMQRSGSNTWEYFITIQYTKTTD